jgi:hypothetical protein
VPVRVHLDAVPVPEPRGDRLAQGWLARGGRVAADGADGVAQRLADEGRRGFVGVTDREVGEGLAVGPEVVGEVLQPGQGVATELIEAGFEVTMRCSLRPGRR